MPTISTFYPKLSDLLPLDKIPNELHFVHQGLSTFLDNISYRNLQVSHSSDGTSTSVYIELLIDKKIDPEVPNELGSNKFKLVLNPDYNGTSGASVIPLYFNFSWKILKYIRAFNPSTFSYTPEEIFDIIFEIVHLTDEKLISVVANNLINNEHPYEVIVDDILSEYGVSITLPTSYNDASAISEILGSIPSISPTKSAREVVFNLYILNLSNVDETVKNLSRCFADIFGRNIVSTLKQLLIPKIFASASVGIGIEIPRNVLIPMKETSASTITNPEYEEEADITKKVLLVCSAGDLFFESTTGRIGFNQEIVLSLSPYPKGKIKGTPFTIGFTSARLDFNKVSGEGSTAKYRTRISVATAEIVLPKIFKNTSSNPTIFAEDVIIDSENGFSGKVGIGGGILQYTFANGLTVVLNSFDVTFVENVAIASSVNGSLTIPGIQNNPLDIEIIFNDGFYVKVLAPSGGIDIIDNPNILLTLDGLSLGQQETVWKLGFAASFVVKKEIPALDKIFPKSFILRDFLISSDGSQTLFDIEAIWKNGANMRGNQTDGLKAYFPVNKNNENGGFKLKGVQLNAKATPNLEIETLLVGAGLKIGPIEASVDDIGAKISFINVGESSPLSNIGPYQVNIKFVGPKGIALSINAKGLEGSGYLYANDGEYRGGLYLKFGNIKLNALGIINTKMPDGSSGFALLVLISAEFSPLNIGFGLTLNGVGGLLGLHHTFDTDYLRDGIKNHTVDHILFPDLSSTSKIIDAVNDVNKILPIKKHQFAVGPMFKLGWPVGTNLVKLDVGVFIEFSDPFRIAILGKLSMLLPKKDPKVISINVAFVGIIDFDEKYISFDASIYDSNILDVIKLSGDMALRVFWGEHREFLLTVGGFHPSYNAPAYLKLPAKLERLTISLVDADWGSVEISIKLQTYFALTSNTLQFGTRLDILIKFWVLEIVGVFGFDVLFQFSPFKFQSNVYAMLAVKFKGEEILSISMDFFLEGPGPWHALGHAEFKVLKLKKKVNFEKTWGDAPNTSMPPIAVKPLIEAELNKKENWTSDIKSSKQAQVQLKPYLGDKILVDPMGELVISQNVAPLGITLEKFGASVPSDGGSHNITGVFFGTSTTAMPTEDMKENFAPAQFRNMSDDQKLKAASFEFLKSGVKVKSSEWLADAFITKELEYEVITIDAVNREINTLNYKPAKYLGNGLVRGGLIAENPIRIKEKIEAIQPYFSIVQETFKVVSKDTLEPLPSVADKTMAETFDEISYSAPSAVYTNAKTWN